QRRQPPRLLPVPLPVAASRRSERALAREQPAVFDRPAPHADPPPHAGTLGGQGYLGPALFEHGSRPDEARHLPLHAHLPLDAAQADPGPREAVLAPRRVAREEPVRGREAARRAQASDRARGAADSRTPGPVNLAASRVGALALFGPYCRREWVLADGNALLEYSDAGRRVLMRARDDSPAMRELLLNIDREVESIGFTRVKHDGTTTVGYTSRDGRPLVIKRYNTKNPWHFVRRAVRRSRARN